MHAVQRPVVVGSTFALLAALLFGVSTPFLRRFSAGEGPFTSAALLYVGAALVAFGTGQGRDYDAPLRAGHAGRVVVVAILGAVLAPACLAWGLGRTGGVVGSLLLASEALFTVALARAVYREPVGRRVVLAVAAIGAGSALLVLRGAAGDGGRPSLLGSVAVLAATCAWALDNVVTRPLADVSPRQIVIAKSFAGAALSASVAALLGERMPALRTCAGLLATGALGYGASLRFYLLAQRSIGAARTASVFGAAPFLGALAAWAMERGAGRGHAGMEIVAPGALVLIGVFLHLTEDHGHEHAHPSGVHEHAHRHDDGHHDHVHEPPVKGVHSHVHSHETVTHTHPHASDLHHQHRHT